MEAKESQKQAIANHLNLGLSLTPLEAIKLYGCTKLSTRVGELENEGRIPVVKRKFVEVKTRYGKTVVMSYQVKPMPKI